MLQICISVAHGSLYLGLEWKVGFLSLSDTKTLVHANYHWSREMQAKHGDWEARILKKNKKESLSLLSTWNNTESQELNWTRESMICFVALLWLPPLIQYLQNMSLCSLCVVRGCSLCRLSSSVMMVTTVSFFGCSKLQVKSGKRWCNLKE
jgi:hypothetical protein